MWSVPQEGGTGWFDTMAIPKGAPHKFTAEVFMNYMLRPEVAANNSNTNGYATANQIAVEKYIDPQLPATQQCILLRRPWPASLFWNPSRMICCLSTKTFGRVF